jgi:tetratricopeptide (TPR) repeat protein
MLAWLLGWRRAKPPVRQEIAASAIGQSVAASGDIINSPIQIGLNENDVGRILEEKLDRKLAEISREKGVPEAPLREVLKRLGETEVAETEIPDRLAKAADELIRLRADLARLSNDRPEFAAIRARASALIDKGDFDAARAALNEGRQAARAMREEMSRTEASFLRDEARVDRLQLNYDAACAKFAEAAHLDPDNVWLWIELSDLWVTRGSLAEAGKALAAARDAAVRTGADRDLAASYDRLGNVQVGRGDLASALTSYRDGLAIAKRLAKSEPGNTERQRDLSVSYGKVGDVQVAQGDLVGALASYREDLAISDRLARSDPGNAGRQRDLSVSYEKIGDVQVAQRDLAGAFASYSNGLTLIDGLTRADPGNAGWQRDLAISNERVAYALRKIGNNVEALEAFQRGHAIMVRLTALSPDNAGWKRDLDRFEARIAEISG